MREYLDADALVIGAGPAGSAAAITLAQRGLRVVLADRAAFPRDKACGDALIPDALAALGRLGVLPVVLSRARRLSGLAITAPGGSTVALGGECATVPRKVLDDTLRRAAVAAGARFVAPARAVAPLEDGERVAGALFQTAGPRPLQVAARWTILACGAASADLLNACGMLLRREPSAMAARVYIRVSPPLAAAFTDLLISFQRALKPGYGWVFPGPDDTFNVGVGVFCDGGHSTSRANLRVLMDRFCTTFPPARQLLADSTARTTGLVGAPLRTGLGGARLGRRGLLVAGEAAGTTYSLTGEGIGKALATGIAAGETAAEAIGSGKAKQAWEEDYQRRLTSDFGHLFGAYRLAQDYMTYPIVADYLAWRARKGAYVRRHLEGLFNETADARTLFSPGGLMRALLG